MMWILTPLDTVVDTIRVAVAPVFLLSGIAAILSVMTGRLTRIVERARTLGEKAKNGGVLDPNHCAELNLIPRRIHLINLAIVMSIAAALLICLVIALLFVSSLVHLPIGIVVAVVFITSMTLMMGGLVSLLAEVRLTLRLLYVDATMLARENPKS